MSLITHAELDRTPFHLTTTEQGTYIRMGNYQITGLYETKEAAQEALSTDLYNIVFNMIIVVNNYLHNNTKSHEPTSDN